MRNPFKILLGPAVYWSARNVFPLLLRGLRIFYAREQPLFVLSPASPGSLGDEAMMVSLISVLEEAGTRDIFVIQVDTGDQWELPGVHTSCVHISCSKYRFSTLLSFAWRLRKCKSLLVIGADIMDGGYSEAGSVARWELVEVASKLGVKTEVLGFSFIDSPPEGVISAIVALPNAVRLCARDPLSHSRLVKCTAKQIDLVADLAFMLKPDSHGVSPTIVANFVNRARHSGRIVVAINACALNMPSRLSGAYSAFLQQQIDAYVDAIEHISMRNACAFLFIPHDVRNHQGRPSDVQLCHSILNRLRSELASHSFVVPFPVHAAQIKFIVGQADFVVTGRMHLLIAALGMCVPAVAISYQGKFDGLFMHFGLDGLTIDPETAFIQNALKEFVSRNIEQRALIQNRIISSLPCVLEFSRRNICDAILVTPTHYL